MLDELETSLLPVSEYYIYAALVPPLLHFQTDGKIICVLRLCLEKASVHLQITSGMNIVLKVLFLISYTYNSNICCSYHHQQRTRHLQYMVLAWLELPLGLLNGKRKVI